MAHFLKSFLFFLLSAGIAIAAPARADLAQALKTVLGADWTLTQEGSNYIITYKPQIIFYNDVALSAGEAVEQTRVPNGEKGTYSIKLIVGPLMTREVYAELQKDEVREKLKTKPEYQTQDYYLVDGLLPKAFGPDYSIYMATTRHPYFGIWPYSAAADCNKTCDSTLKLFESYR